MHCSQKQTWQHSIGHPQPLSTAELGFEWNFCSGNYHFHPTPAPYTLHPLRTCKAAQLVSPNVTHAFAQSCFCVGQGCCALSTCFDPCLLALPSSSTSGTMRIYNAAITGSSVECEVTAHNSPVAVMAWNQDASLLASASNKGTVLRVHKMPQVITASRQPNTVVAAAPGRMYLLSVALKHFHQSMVAMEKAHSTNINIIDIINRILQSKDFPLAVKQAIAACQESI